MEKITSVQNPKIKFITKLNNSSRVRREEGLFLLEGLRLCSDVLNSDYKIDELFFTEEFYEKNKELTDKLILKSNKISEITQNISEHISDTKTPQGIFCLCKLLDKLANSNKIDFNGKYIALENIQDPSNLGAICRTAEALGINGAVISSCCDIYNPKAQRAAMGSLLRLPITEVEDLPSFLELCKLNGMATLASTPDSNAVDIKTLDGLKGAICVIGNEAQGVTESIIGVCDFKVTIKMLGRAESLNASAAASIIMWEMLR